jgi:hypothetical protein
MSASSTKETNTTQSGTSASNTTSSNTENQSALTNQNTSGVNTQNSSTWAPQANALIEAFKEAQRVYGQQSQAQAPTNFVAGLTPEQIATYNKMVSAGNDTSASSALANTGGALASAGTNGVQGALSGLSGYDASKTNNADSLVADANKYVAGQDIDAQVRNAMLTATQTARDVTLPGIEQHAATSGNTNSSRTGIAQGLVERGLAQQSADLGATLRSNAFKDGLSLAQTQAAANNTQNLAALTSQGSLGNTAANSGMSGISSSVDSLIKSLGLSGTGGAGLQSGNQADLTNQLQQYLTAQSAGSVPLDNLMKIIGSQSWGQSSTGTNTGTTTGSNVQTGTQSGSSAMTGSTTGTGHSVEESTPSAMSIIGGLLGFAGQGKSLFSDARLKSDIKLVGQLHNGLGVYSYHYTDDPFKRTHIGVLAQEVEQHRPEAVGEALGFKTVDYELATQ